MLDCQSQPPKEESKENISHYILPTQDPPSRPSSQGSQNARRQHGSAHDRPARDLNLTITQLAARVPDEMPNAIESMKRERQRNTKLEPRLPPPGQRAERSRQRGGIEEMPAEEGGHEVGEPEDVEPARERGAGDAIQRAGVPGDLRAVDGQVRAYGAAEPLRGEDRCVWRYGFGCDCSSGFEEGRRG